MLQVTHVSKHYPTPRGPLVVLDDATFSLTAGQAAVITGPSGSGKSSLLYMLGALEPPSSGTVTLNGVDPHGLTPSALAAFRNSQVGFVFQDHCLLPQCTTLENVLVPTMIARPDTSSGGESYDVRARALLQHVGLAERLEHRPGELSGGEKQRAAIARALIRRPTLLLCDEPTGNLDQASAETVAQLLLALHQEQQNVLIVVTHSERLAAQFPIRFVIEKGRVSRVS